MARTGDTMEILESADFFCDPALQEKLPPNDVLTFGHLHHGWRHGSEHGRYFCASHEDIIFEPVCQFWIRMIVLLHPTLQIFHTIMEQLYTPFCGAEIEVGGRLARLEAVWTFVI